MLTFTVDSHIIIWCDVQLITLDDDSHSDDDIKVMSEEDEDETSTPPAKTSKKQTLAVITHPIFWSKPFINGFVHTSKRDV